MIPILVIVGKDVDGRDAIFALLAPEFIGEALGKGLGDDSNILATAKKSCSE